MVENIGVAVLDIEIEAEVDKIGVAVVVVKEDIAVVVSGVDATDGELEAGEVDPPNVHNDPNGIYPKKESKNSANSDLFFENCQYLHLGQSRSVARRLW